MIDLVALVLLLLLAICAVATLTLITYWYLDRRRAVTLEEMAGAISALTSARDAYGREPPQHVVTFMDEVKRGRTSYGPMAGVASPAAIRGGPPGLMSTSKTNQEAWDCRTRFLQGASEEYRGGATILTIPDDAKEEELEELGKVYYFDRTSKPGDRIEILGGRVMLEDDPDG